MAKKFFPALILVLSLMIAKSSEAVVFNSLYYQFSDDYDKYGAADLRAERLLGMDFGNFFLSNEYGFKFKPLVPPGNAHQKQLGWFQMTKSVDIDNVRFGGYGPGGRGDWDTYYAADLTWRFLYYDLRGEQMSPGLYAFGGDADSPAKLRFEVEMKYYWYPYGQQPANYYFLDGIYGINKGIVRILQAEFDDDGIPLRFAADFFGTNEGLYRLGVSQENEWLSGKIRYNSFFDMESHAIPEPSTMLFLGFGILGMIIRRQWFCFNQSLPPERVAVTAQVRRKIGEDNE